MREILFRAKTEDGNGTFRWIEGHLSKCDGDWIICDDLGAGDFVEESTICQYTGVTDMNGKKIFEGDIFKYHHLGDKRTYKVIYHEKYNAFVRCSGRGFDFLYHPKNIEVIGNIFDNPELVEV